MAAITLAGDGSGKYKWWKGMPSSQGPWAPANHVSAGSDCGDGCCQCVDTLGLGSCQCVGTLMCLFLLENIVTSFCRESRFLNSVCLTALCSSYRCWCLYYSVHLFWRRKWQPTPVFLPGESQGQRGAQWTAVYGIAQNLT